MDSNSRLGTFAKYTATSGPFAPELVIERGESLRMVIDRDELGPMLTEIIEMARVLGVTGGADGT